MTHECLLPTFWASSDLHFYDDDDDGEYVKSRLKIAYRASLWIFYSLFCCCTQVHPLINFLRCCLPVAPLQKGKPTGSLAIFLQFHSGFVSPLSVSHRHAFTPFLYFTISSPALLLRRNVDLVVAPADLLSSPETAPSD